jgi:hypothetical protein
MRKMKFLNIIVILVLAVPLFLMTGCPQHTDSLYGVRVAGDGNGGAIAVYEATNGGNIYAQKISADGKNVWGENGVLLGNSGSQTYSYFSFNIIHDGAGGAIVAWPDSSQNKLQPTSHVTRISAEGNVLWQRDFSYFNQLVSDGSGGAIICDDNPLSTNSDNKDLIIVKIDSNGDYPWGIQGVTVPRKGYQGNTLQITSDGSGGIIVVWEELHYPSEAKPGETISKGSLFTQLINSAGNLKWGDGVLVYTTPENTYAESPQIISDSSGGAVIVWHQVYNGRIESGSPEAQMMDVFVQKVDTTGNILWKPNGIPLEINKNAVNALPLEPLTVSDKAGGAIIIWRDSRAAAANSAGVYAQKVDAEGNLKWQVGGTKVSTTSLNPHPVVVSSDSGGAIIVYSFQQDWGTLNAQKLDSNGQRLWPENGISITKGGFAGNSVVSDGQGGLIVAWGVNSSGTYVQRVNAEGRSLWGEKGIKLGKK